jgi:8-oxo-dGTP diphosphatase
MMRVVLVAAAALFDADGRVLLAERPKGKAMAGLWEFPGGKVAEGETAEVAVVRGALRPLAFASHAYPEFHLLMPLFVCTQWSGTPTPREDQRLQWLRPDAIDAALLPPADVPLLHPLAAFAAPPSRSA